MYGRRFHRTTLFCVYCYGDSLVLWQARRMACTEFIFDVGDEIGVCRFCNFVDGEEIGYVG